MPYENCEACKKCLPCPVTNVAESEGAYYIAQNMGNEWFCTSCFFCEDICPDYSPRKYAIEKRRHEDQTSNLLIDPLEKLMTYGTIFPISKEVNTFRVDFGLPILPEINSSEIKVIYDSILSRNEQQINLELKPLQQNKKEQAIIFQEKITEVALFLGCLIPYRVFDYELSARNILEKLHIRVNDLPFACCGSIMTESQSSLLWLVSAAYNLALAEEAGHKILTTLCGGCTGNLRRVNYYLKEDSILLEKVNCFLSKVNKKYNGSIEVLHITELLLLPQVKNSLKKLIDKKRSKELSNLNSAVQIPCQIIRPKESSPNAELGSKILKDLLGLTTIKITTFPYETLCCGSSMLLYDKAIAYRIAKKRIYSLIKKKVDLLILGCGNCSMNYTVHQSAYSSVKLPTFFFSEILEYAIKGSNENLIKLLEEKEIKDDSK
ncbi:MAG: hypothetical protein JXA54_05085 [Candidatus Heimdallarchaeota archaeon]|nr:hypothetical protein [Candidatus Heimdallarchaeota archaeon]